MFVVCIIIIMCIEKDLENHILISFLDTASKGWPYKCTHAILNLDAYHNILECTSIITDVNPPLHSLISITKLAFKMLTIFWDVLVSSLTLTLLCIH
jgi:hypothetical protein